VPGHHESNGQYRNTIKSPTYSSFFNMIVRCHYKCSPTYQTYGAAGIRVCARWVNSFQAFLNDMGPRPKGHTLDRINPFGNYTPDNCRWATPKEQAGNRQQHVQKAA
jgi:hypothetical protein